MRCARRPRLLGLLVLLACIVAMFGPWHEPARFATHTVVVGMQPSAVAVDPRTGRAFVVSYGDSTLSIVDAPTADLIRTLPLGGPPGPLIVDEQTGRAFVVTDGNSSVSVFETRGGRLLRVIAVSAAERPAMAVDTRTDRIFLTGPDGVVVLDGRDGSVLRTIPLAVAPNALAGLAVDARTGHVFAVDHNDAAVIMMDTRGGRVLRAIAVGSGPTDVVVDERTGRAFVVNADSYSLSVIDTRDGALVRTLSLDPGPLAVDERTGRVFMASDGGASYGNLYVLDAATGRLLRTAYTSPAASPTALAVDQRSGRVFVAAGGGVSVLDAGSGTLLHGPDPGMEAAVGLAVDERAGRAFAIGQRAIATVPAAAAGTGLTVWAVALWQQIPWLPHSTSPTPIPAGTGIMSVIDATR